MRLHDYLAAKRGRAAEIANLAGFSGAFLQQIASGKRECPPKRAALLEVTCKYHVRRWDLRPDDWHRIWPELIGTEGAPAVPVVEEARDA